MNSNIFKFVLIYLAGICTYALFQHHNLLGKVDKLNMQVMSLDAEAPDSAAAGSACPCDNEGRYNVDPREDSKNYPITSVPTCSTMVANGNPAPRGGTAVGKGAWFSKVTLDLMFCHKQDANGIYVYKALNDDGSPTYVVEAARSNKINTTDDGTSFIYYSRTMCPTVCGQCGL